MLTNKKTSWSGYRLIRLGIFVVVGIIVLIAGMIHAFKYPSMDSLGALILAEFVVFSAWVFVDAFNGNK